MVVACCLGPNRLQPCTPIRIGFKQALFLAAIFICMISISWSLAYPKVFTVAAVIPMFPGISADTAMIMVVEILHLGYSEACIETVITDFLKASVIVAALSIVLWL